MKFQIALAIERSGFDGYSFQGLLTKSTVKIKMINPQNLVHKRAQKFPISDGTQLHNLGVLLLKF